MAVTPRRRCDWIALTSRLGTVTRISMRTTMVIDDELFRQAKKRAAETGTSLSEVVNRALREAFSPKPAAAALPPFRMVTFGRSQPHVDHTPADLWRAEEDDDVEGLGS
jgi:Arc/MetJ family transcription regulator